MYQTKEGIQGQSFFVAPDGRRIPVVYEKVTIVRASGEVTGYRPIFLEKPSGSAIVYGESIDGVGKKLT